MNIVQRIRTLGFLTVALSVLILLVMVSLAILVTPRNVALAAACLALGVYSAVNLLSPKIANVIEDETDVIDEEHLRLKLGNAEMHIAYFGGLGLALLIPALTTETYNWGLTAFGLTLLTITQLFLYGQYYPWYALLDRRHAIRAELNKRKK